MAAAARGLRAPHVHLRVESPSRPGSESTSPTLRRALGQRTSTGPSRTSGWLPTPRASLTASGLWAPMAAPKQPETGAHTVPATAALAIRVTRRLWVTLLLESNGIGAPSLGQNQQSKGLRLFQRPACSDYILRSERLFTTRKSAGPCGNRMEQICLGLL
jgi:hypothetical protein